MAEQTLGHDSKELGDGDETDHGGRARGGLREHSLRSDKVVVDFLRVRGDAFEVVHVRRHARACFGPANEGSARLDREKKNTRRWRLPDGGPRPKPTCQWHTNARKLAD